VENGGLEPYFLAGGWMMGKWNMSGWQMFASRLMLCMYVLFELFDRRRQRSRAIEGCRLPDGS
jgi:hypothetical protein